jgi:hypothetical protein
MEMGGWKYGSIIAKEAKEKDKILKEVEVDKRETKMLKREKKEKKKLIKKRGK